MPTGYEEFDSGQQLTQEQMDLLQGKKKPKPPKPNAEKRYDPRELGPDIEPDDDYVPETKKGISPQAMQQAEEEVETRQYMEWKEKKETLPESEVQVSDKLIRIDARMATKKELMPAKDAAGIERNVAITLEEEYPEIFTDDLVKGNLDDIERACIFGHVSIINQMKMIGQAKGFNFVPASRFNQHIMNTIINSSRAKRGFSAILVKTDKHVSEGVVEHVQKAFEEKKRKRWGVF